MPLRQSLPTTLAAVAGLAVATLTGVGPAHAAVERTPTVLPSLVADRGATASAVNRAGVVVGSAEAADGYWHATVWRNGRIADLGTLGGYNSQAEDIDDNGQIVGAAQDVDGTMHAVVWIDDRIHDLGTIGTDSWAKASSNGVIAVHWSVDGNSPWSGARAAVVTGTPATGLHTTIIDNVPTGLSADAVNATGTIAGTNHQIDYGLPDWNSAQAYVWRNGVARNLGTLGGPSSWAYDINDTGHVIGRSDVPGDGSPAFFWNGSTMRALPAPAGSSPTAQAINNADVIAGTLGRDTQAVVWASPTATPRPLRAPAGSVGTAALDLNQRGAIVGFAEYLQPQFHMVAVVWR